MAVSPRAATPSLTPAKEGLAGVAEDGPRLKQPGTEPRLASNPSTQTSFVWRRLFHHTVRLIPSSGPSNAVPTAHCGLA